MGRYKTVEATITVQDAAQDGMTDLKELGEEMGSWRDNTEGTPAESSSRFEVVSETATALEDFDEPNLDDLPLEIQDREVKYTYQKVQSGRQKTPSRAVRCSNACAMIQAAIDELEGLDEDYALEIRDDATTIASELTEVISTVESLDFPGMFG